MTDQEILRELASAYMEAANEPVNTERRERAYATNGLQAVRPLVWIHELPWHELNIDDALTLRCEGALAREIEQFLRRSLLQWRYFQADMILEPYYPVSMCIHSTGIGFQVIEEVLVGDDKNNIISHSYKDQLDSLEKLEILHNPVVTRDYDEEKKRVSDAQALLGDAMPVKLCPQNMYYYAPWDRVCRMRGMTPLLMDLAAEPELMHATIQKFSSVLNADIDALNAVNAFGVSASSLHCTPPYSRELEAVEAKEGPSVHSAWFRALAQPFGEVSPAMHDEYDIQYLLPIARKFGLCYYGCCEPLSDRIDILRRIPNLRKVGVTPWSSVEVSAEKLGKDFVFSRKPNPAMVATTLDEDAVRKDIAHVMEACLRNSCPCEFVLKDISTVGYKPQNIIRWAQVVEETIDRYY